MIKVGINGYGTIGRRVADAVSAQNDMTVVGVLKTHPDYVAHAAASKFRIFTPDGDKDGKFRDNGILVEGDLQNLIDSADIIIDATPEGNGKKNLESYRKSGVKAIFQGGEQASTAQGSFNSYSNYESCTGKDYLRVVSCNTTGLARSLSVLRDTFGLKDVQATLIRRGTDPNDNKKGPINAIVPDLHFPSHHGPDVMTVMPGVNIETSSVNVPTTLMHVHAVSAVIESGGDNTRAIDAFAARRRILTVSGSEGLVSTAQIMDMAKEMNRNRSDLYEIAIWKESVNLRDHKINYIQAVHQESDVVPENIDAIRSMFQLADKEKSLKLTDAHLGIGNRVK